MKPVRFSCSHGGVHQRIAGAAFAPGGEQGVGALALSHQRIEGRLERMRHHARVARTGSSCRTRARSVPTARPARPRRRRRRRCARAACAPGRARSACRSAGAATAARWRRGPGSRARVVAARRGRKAASSARRRTCRASGRGRPVEAELGQRRQRVVGRGRRQRAACGAVSRAPGIRLGRQALEPGILVGREYRVRAAGQGQHLVLFEDHLVLEGLQAAAGARSVSATRRSRRDRLRLVVVVGKHGFGVQLPPAPECRPRRARGARSGNLPLHAAASSSHQAGVDEMHAPVVATAGRPGYRYRIRTRIDAA
jgi:hypothetical protein